MGERAAALIGLTLLLALLVAFVREKRPPVVHAIVGVVAMLVFGLLPPDRLLAVFGNPAPLTIGAMFILSGALQRTGVNATRLLIPLSYLAILGGTLTLIGT